MPARVETHPAFGIGQNVHPLGIDGVEAGIGEHTPMRCLQIMQAFDLLFALEIASGFRKGLETMEEIAETGLQMAFEIGTAAAKKIAQLDVQPCKRKSLAQASRLAASRLIRWRFLHQNPSPRIDWPIPKGTGGMRSF
jgi:hypothetical protein